MSEYLLKTPFHVVEVDLRCKSAFLVKVTPDNNSPEADAADVKQILGDLTGRYTFPNVFVNGQSIGGADEVTRLHRTGELRELLVKNKLVL